MPGARPARPEGGPDDACGRAISVSRDREQTLHRYNQNRASKEEHEIRDDPSHHLPDVGDRANGACRYDQRYRRQEEGLTLLIVDIQESDDQAEHCEYPAKLSLFKA